MSLSQVSNHHELTLGISFIDNNSSIQAADQEQTMFFQKDYFDYSFVLILIVFSRLNILQKLSRFATKLSHISSCISQEELSTFVAKLTCSNIGTMIVFIQFCEYLFERSSRIIINSHVV